MRGIREIIKICHGGYREHRERQKTKTLKDTDKL